MLRLYKSLTIILFAICLTSCYNSEKRSENIFHYNDYTGIASLDPAFAKNQSIMWAVHQLYNTLVDVDSQLHITPSVAKEWKISEEGTVYTFYLRNNVFFQDDDCFKNGKGRRLIAEDVVYSLKRLNDKS